jgi:hypothetical protein
MFDAPNIVHAVATRNVAMKAQAATSNMAITQRRCTLASGESFSERVLDSIMDPMGFRSPDRIWTRIRRELDDLSCPHFPPLRSIDIQADGTA